MSSKKRNIKVLVYIGILLAVLTGFALLQYNVTRSDAKSTYDIENNLTEGQNSPFDVNIVIVKQWKDIERHKRAPVGAEYDGTIVNLTDEPMEDWELVLNVPEEAVIDSSWNGNYSIKNGKLTMTPLEYNHTLNPGEMETFGFVIYSKELIDFNGSSLGGNVKKELYQSPTFYILAAVLVIWLISLIVSIILYARTMKYVKKQQHDTQLITQAMNTFAKMIDAKDTYTRGHSTRVAIYSKEIARRMKFPEEEVNKLYYIALMHDCGKIGIPDSVLKKPGSLTEEEWHQIQSHTTVGSNVLEDFTTINGIRDGAMYHHERYDGTGYPAGLKGVDIPLYARIICVADSYDAMSSNRCYRDQLDQQKILDELEKNAGSQFDPTIIKYMVAMIKDGFVKQAQASYRS